MSSRVIFNIGVTAATSMILFAIFMVALFVGGIKRKTDKFFAILTFSYLLTAVAYFSLYMYRLYGDHNPIVIKVIYTVIFSGLYSAGYFTIEYCLHYFLGENKLLKRIIRFVILPILLVVAGFALYLTIENRLFTINKDVIVVYGNFISFYIIFSMANLFGFVLLLIKPRRSVLEYVSFFFLTICIPLALIFEYIYIDNGIFCLALSTFYLTHFLLYYVENTKRISKQETLLREQQNNLMMSQIQPHFIYNCLSSISYLCQVDGKKASESIDDFARYLRMNFTALNKVDVVPFEKEMEYVDVYLKLEKLRFGDRVKVVYDLKAKNFTLPCLSVQPLVENAVKHGVTKKIHGGTIWIKTREENNKIIITVKDNGVGFRKIEHKDERAHLGLSNTKSRIEKMCNGSLTYESVPNKGTTVTIILPKSNTTKVKEK